MVKPAGSSSTSAASRRPETLVGWMESLADRTRLRLLRILEQHDLGVVELCEILQLPQSTVSRHLKILADQGWLHNRRNGTTRLYRMSLDELDPAARKLWTLAREQTDGWPTIRQDELRLERRLRHRETDSQAFFAGAVGKWDRIRRDFYGESFTTSAMLALIPGDYVVADLGCGTGAVTAQLAHHVKRVIGVDSSPAMLKAARKRIGDRANVDLLRADLSSVPLESNSCDAALLLLVLAYAPDPAPVLREASRILKLGGKLVIVDLLPHDREDFRRQMGQAGMGLSLEQVHQLQTAASLVPAHCAPLSPEPNVKGPALFLCVSRKQ
jgi:ArsR family transcriptional regulator